MSPASSVLTHLGELPIDEFLKNYWQQHAVFLPQALAGFHSPLSPDELAGLALEEVIESRLIIHDDQAPWQLKTGPFTERDFAELPAEQWSLLVQAVDHWEPQVADLLDKFRFIPNWRLDDVMVSYAPTGGSAGPHFDYYDVFLVQGAGTREWHIGQRCDSTSPRLEGTDLNILRDFTTEATYVAQPGDVLYIPPGVAHWGTALDDECMTYSIGFRAPSEADILDEFGQHIAATLTNDNRYKDQNARASTSPGAIDIAVIEQLQKQLISHLTPANIAQWFGRYMTEPKLALESTPEHITRQKWQQWLKQNAQAERELGARFCYFTDDNATTLFVDGQAFSCSAPLAAALSNQRQWSIKSLDALLSNDTDTSLVMQLLTDNTLVIIDNQDELDDEQS
jgi:50S ribosomal protein L16 3-hydroxylase